MLVKPIIVKAIPALRFLLAGLLLYAGTAKLVDVSVFAAQIQRLGVGNASLAAVAAHYLPFLEIGCGFALVFRRFTLEAMTLYMALLVAFETVLANALASKVQADCGCFGQLFGGASVQTAFNRNLGLLVIGSVVLWRECVLARRFIQ